MRWRLCVDESGRFDNKEEETALAGLLVTAELFRRFLNQLRATLAAVEPGIPWPLHAAHFQATVSIALASSARRGGAAPVVGSELEWRDRAADAVLAFLGVSCPDALAKARIATAAGRLPSFTLVKEMQRALEACGDDEIRAAEWALSDTVDEIRTCFRRGILKTLESAPGARGFPVAAGESRKGDGERDGVRLLGSAAWRQFKPAELRYLAALATLVRRVEDLLELAGGHHEVALSTSTFEFAGACVRRADLAKLLGCCARPNAPVQWQMSEPEAYFDDQLDPCFVLADYVANQVRRQLDRPDDESLSTVEANLHRTIGASFRLHSNRGPCSRLSATGVARDFVDGARRRRSEIERLAPTLRAARLWAAEQAREWATLLGGAAP